MKLIRSFRAARLSMRVYSLSLAVGFVGGAVLGACSTGGKGDLPLASDRAVSCSLVTQNCNAQQACCAGLACAGGRCTCGRQAQACNAQAPCCAGFGCTNGQCACSGAGQACNAQQPCCGDLGCVNGQCGCTPMWANCAAGGPPCCAGPAGSGGVCNTDLQPSICQPYDPTLIVTDTAVLNSTDQNGNPVFSLQAVLQ